MATALVRTIKNADGTISTVARPVTRKVASISYGDLMVTLAEEGIYLRQSRHRQRYLIPFGVAFQRAVQLHLAHDRADNPRAKKAKRGRRVR